MSAEQLTLPLAIEGTLPPRAKCRPIIKWAGGKSWAVPFLSRGIYRYLAKTQGFYYEPFLGGAALALDLGVPRMVLSDLCEPLVEMYRAVRDNPAEVAWTLSALAAAGVDKANYYRVRDDFNAERDDSVKLAARFIYLNKLNFNGVYRENKKGAYNVPYGDAGYRPSVVGRTSSDAIESLFPSSTKLKALSKAFKEADIFVADFREPISEARAGDVVVADPPYAEAFSSYTSKGFSMADQEDLAEELRAAHAAGALIVAFNADHPDIRKLYQDWAHVIPTKEMRQVAQKVASRARAGCVLITTDVNILGT